MNKSHLNINDELKACEIHFKVIVKDESKFYLSKSTALSLLLQAIVVK